MQGVFYLRFLGPARIERDGESVLTSPKLLALLGYLVVGGGPVPREHLADLFWGDKPEERGRANLSWALHHLSGSLPGCFEANRHAVQFRQSPHRPSDLDAFQRLATQGDPAALAAAVDLYQGEFLEGLRLDGCHEFEIWLVGERERWRRRAASILEELIAHHDRCGERGRALRSARRLLALEPWREQTHRQVMRLLAQNGQRGAALAQYETCRRLLAERLGVEPGERTVALYARIRDGPPPGYPHPRLTAQNFPAPLTPFVGREAELVQIRRCLLDPACQLLTLVGPRGRRRVLFTLDSFEHLLFPSPDPAGSDVPLPRWVTRHGASTPVVRILRPAPHVKQTNPRRNDFGCWPAFWPGRVVSVGCSGTETRQLGGISKAWRF
jgi:DNA-binding SARP family transcriptional activator